MQIVLLGAPGSGKGTQAQRLHAEHGLCQLSTGDLLRAAVADETPIGLQVKAAMEAGSLVPDAIVLEMIRAKLADPAIGGNCVLDGFPRTLEQARGLESLIAELGQRLDAVIFLHVDFDVLFKRLTGRRTCSKTGKLLNVYFSSKEDLDACLADGGELLRRDDDNEDTIRHRLEVYHRQTEPLIEHYKRAGMLKVIDASSDVDVVHASLLDALQLPN